MRTITAWTVCAFMLCACASRGTHVEHIESSQHVDQRMLLPEAGNGSAGKVTRYEMQPQQRFRMPQPRHDAPPRLADDSTRTALLPTTVCVRIIVSEAGTVTRVDALDDRTECREGATAENADLMQAVRDQLLQWTFLPAAVCTWSAGTAPPDEIEQCIGAEHAEPVQVTLMYAFTFEIREGRTIVRQHRG